MSANGVNGLGPFERAALALGRLANEQPLAKRLQSLYLTEFGTRWVHVCTKNLMRTEGLERALAMRPGAGVLLCANHRSFFDSYVISSLILGKTPWAKRLFFPVRSNFFYEKPAGVAVNLVIGGLAMYPPIFRQAEHREKNDHALARCAAFLGEPGTVVGMHPEGTRGKGDDPYTFLPAQPGVGQLILQARPTVLPVFVNGLQNDFLNQLASNFKNGGRQGTPITVVFGEPLDYDDLAAQKPRLTLYKKMADRVMDAIAELGERERGLRARIG